MNKKRPVNLHIDLTALPITAFVSITHRATGVILLAGSLILLCMLDSSLASQEGFDELKSTLSKPFAKFVIWGVLSALAYHTVAGIKHLIADMGYGESLEGGVLGARLTIFVSAVLIIAIGGWILW